MSAEMFVSVVCSYANGYSVVGTGSVWLRFGDVKALLEVRGEVVTLGFDWQVENRVCLGLPTETAAMCIGKSTWVYDSIKDVLPADVVRSIESCLSGIKKASAMKVPGLVDAVIKRVSVSTGNEFVQSCNILNELLELSVGDNGSLEWSNALLPNFKFVSLNNGIDTVLGGQSIAYHAFKDVKSLKSFVLSTMAAVICE